MPIKVRAASLADARQMSELLNEIIEAGGTTALTDPVSPIEIADWIKSDPKQSSWKVAEDDGGKIMGFQFFTPHPDLPSEAADMATFVRVGAVQLGIGSALFSETAKAAVRLGLVWLNANIRADNSGGLTYYQSRGFRTYRMDENVPLADGKLVERVYKRFDL